MVDPVVVPVEDPIVDPVVDPVVDPTQADPAKIQELEKASEKLNKILGDNNVDDVEELIELIEQGKSVKGKIKDINSLDDILSKAKKLEGYEAYWKDQKEKQKKEGEHPEDTIARLEKELENKNRFKEEEDKSLKIAEDTKKAISFFENVVDKLITEQSVPEEKEKIFAAFLGVNNKVNDIDITDKNAIKRALKDTVKVFEDYDQWIIKQYLDGKKEIPAIQKTGESAIDIEKPVKTLKEARSILKERLSSITKGE